MKKLRVVLKPTGFAQMLSDMEPGLFVYLDVDDRPHAVGVKSEYGPEYHCYNEAGEYAIDGKVMPVELVIEEEDL